MICMATKKPQDSSQWYRDEMGNQASNGAAASERAETKIAKRATGAWKSAAAKSLRAGVSITVGIEGKIIRISPDGDQKVVGELPKRVKFKGPLKGKVKWPKGNPK